MTFSSTQEGQVKADTQLKTSVLVLIDFDGTITTRDTLIAFVHFYRGKLMYWFGMLMLAPWMAMFLLKLIPNWKAKQFFLARYFKGESISDFNARGLAFSKKVLPALIRPAAAKAIAEYRKSNATIAVVSASAENWIKPWCDENGILCIATRLEVKNGLITGNIEGRNCYGDEKVCRVRDAFELSKFDKIIAYGDSSGDREMLELAHERHYKPWRD
jgi:HAD superfamily hydrolase (TIGR01490 family)